MTTGMAAALAARRRWDCLPSRFAKARAHLFVLHGTHEHSGRACYEDLALACNSSGLLVSSFDFQGHGRRDGESCRGDFGSLDNAIAESIALIKSEREACATTGLPFIVFGHSLGSLVAFLVSHKLATSALPRPSLVILSGFAMDSISPPFGVKALTPILRAAPSVIHKITKVLSGLNPHGPACPLPPPTELTHDEERAAHSLRDPLMHHGWIQNRTALALLEGRARCAQLVSDWGRSFPFLLIHGAEDNLCPKSACLTLLQHSPQPDKTLRLYDGCFHEVLNERQPARDEAIRDVQLWIEQRLDRMTNNAGEAADSIRLRSRL